MKRNFLIFLGLGLNFSLQAIDNIQAIDIDISEIQAFVNKAARNPNLVLFRTPKIFLLKSYRQGFQGETFEKLTYAQVAAGISPAILLLAYEFGKTQRVKLKNF